MVLRSEYLRTGKAPEGVRPVVFESWERCRMYGVNPEIMPAQSPDPSRLATLRAENQALLHAAEPLLRCTQQKLGEGPYVLAISDRNGTILRLIADSATTNAPETRAANLFEGASWNERDIGCNGIGTCLATRQPVVLIGPEHFQSSYLTWTCIGFPIRRADGEIVGALDISVPNTYVETGNWGWGISAARYIEACLNQESSGRVQHPSVIWNQALSSLVGIIELLVTQLDLPTTHLGFVQDLRRAAMAAVSERTRSEQKLSESEARFRQLAETMPQLVWATDAEGRTDYYNSRATQYKGIDRSPDDPWEWHALLHTDDRAASVAAWQRALAVGEMYQIEHRVQMLDASYRWHLSRALPFRNADGEIVKWFGTTTDIHDQKCARELLERTVAERTAELRDTVAELEHFSYTITHDMRAPLRAMQLFGQILIKEYAGRLDETGRDYLRRITEAAARMDRLVVDTLDYSRTLRTQLPLEPIDAGLLIRSLVESYPQFQSPQADVQITSSFPLVHANAAGVVQCFSILLGNAVKFIEPGTVPVVRVWAEERGTTVRVWIADNGIGIPSQQKQRVFVMFQRLSKKYPGTGVGLALVRKLTEQMNGDVGFESELGKGSRFWVDLNRATTASSA